MRGEFGGTVAVITGEWGAPLGHRRGVGSDGLAIKTNVLPRTSNAAGDTLKASGRVFFWHLAVWCG